MEFVGNKRRYIQNYWKDDDHDDDNKEEERCDVWYFPDCIVAVVLPTTTTVTTPSKPEMKNNSNINMVTGSAENHNIKSPKEGTTRTKIAIIKSATNSFCIININFKEQQQ